MCFSESSSFALAGILTPAGVYCVHKAFRVSRPHLALACFPIGFALQQAVEGVVWHGINNDDPQLVSTAAKGFVFFSHFFWLFFVPFASYCIETKRLRKRVLGALTIFGGLYGASIFLPLLSSADRLTVELVKHSIEYKTDLIYDGVISRWIVRAVYALIIVGSLVLSSDRKMQFFGGMIIASVLFAEWQFGHAFISVWCFFAAAISLYVVYMMYTLGDDEDSGRVATDHASP